MQEQEPGAMLSVRLPEGELGLSEGLSLAVVNASKSCVISGPEDKVEAYRQGLEARGVACKRLHTSHAFHSGMMASAAEQVVAAARGVAFKPAQVPIVSTLTGAFAGESGMSAAEYWGRQVLGTVRFADALRALLAEEGVVLLEVGPGQVLSTLASGQRGGVACAVAASMPPVTEFGEVEAVQLALGRLWVAGVEPEWSVVSGAGAVRVHLPGYVFERQRCWYEPRRVNKEDSTVAVGNIDCDSIRNRGERVEEMVLQQLRVMQEQLRALARSGSGRETGAES
jgi:acyl transferase domain-containing protein